MHSNFTYLAEVPINTKDTLKTALEKANKLLALGFSTLVFPDRARADSNVASIQELLKLGVFEKLPKNKIIPIIATRTKFPEELEEIVRHLKNLEIKNLFVVTGDPHKSSRTSFLTSVDVIPSVAKDFVVGAVLHPDLISRDRDIKKIESGARFLIAQASYDSKKWNEWIDEIINLGIHKQVKLYQTIIPLTNKKVLESVYSLHDISLPKDLYYELSSYDEAQLKNYGINNATAQINEVRQKEVFSGVYIYSKEPPEILSKLMA